MGLTCGSYKLEDSIKCSSVGRSKLSPALFDKAAGSPVTMRNWNTVLKINEMLNSKVELKGTRKEVEYLESGGYF